MLHELHAGTLRKGDVPGIVSQDVTTIKHSHSAVQTDEKQVYTALSSDIQLSNERDRKERKNTHKIRSLPKNPKNRDEAVEQNSKIARTVWRRLSVSFSLERKT